MIGARLVKSAVRADARAEWNVNIQMPDRLGSRSRCVACIDDRSGRHACRYSCGVVIRALAHKVRSIAHTTLSIPKLTLLFFCVITPVFGQTPRPGPTRSVVYRSEERRVGKEC